MPALTLPMSLMSGDASAPAAVDRAQLLVDLLAREEAVIRRVIGRYLRGTANIDDCYQEVCLRATRSLNTVRDPAALRGWLYEIVRHTAIDTLRRSDSRPAQHDAALAERPAVGDQAREPIDQLLTRERLMAVRRALDELPPTQREVIELRLRDDLDHEQIAARLGITRGAVEVRLCRGRSALRARLDDVFGGDL